MRKVVNDIYIKVRQSWHTLRSPEHAIHSITKHTASTHSFKCRREVPEVLNDDVSTLFAAQALDPVALLERTILLQEIYAMLKNQLDKDIFNLRFQGYTYEEMAVILDVDSDTLRSRYCRAVQRLKLINSPSPPSLQQPIIVNRD